MSFTIEYADATGLNIYAMLYVADNIGTALRYQIDQTLATFSDAAQTTGFFINLDEDSVRKGVYFSSALESIAPLALNTPNEFTLMVYEKLGSNQNVATDLIKAYKSVVWDGNCDVGECISPELGGGNYLGSYNYNNRVYLYILPTNHLHAPSSPDSSYYHVYNPSGTLVASGGFTAFNGISFSGSFLCSGTPFINGNYAIHASGYFGNAIASEQFTFTLASTGTTTSVSTDVLTGLGWVTGIVNTAGATTTTFATTLPSTVDDHYNGQILYIASGTLKGVGRIVSDYVGASKTIVLNKALTGAPGSGVPIVILPIGGELNVA